MPGQMEPGTPYEVVYGNDISCLEELRQLMMEKLGYEAAAVYRISASLRFFGFR